MPKFTVISKEEAQKHVKFERLLEKNLRKYLNDLGDKVLVEVQKTQPKQFSKEKVSLKETKIGFDIVYENVSGAYDLHEGAATEKLTQPWKSSIPSHQRRLPSGRVTKVRAHIKTYKPWYKPVKLNEQKWVAVDINEMLDKNSGQPWLQEAWTKVLKKQDAGMRKILPEFLTISKK